MGNRLSKKEYQVVVGLDEAGRGPLAGPVVACAVCVLDFKNWDLFRNSKLEIRNLRLRDSKLLSAKQRTLIYEELRRNTDLEWGIGRVSEKQIDKINILQATRLAMKKAFQSLSRKLHKKGVEPQLLIIDGTSLIDVSISQKAIIKADATVLQCMAASIIAKVTRDRLMIKLHKKYPVYGFDRHKGYGTRMHIEMIARYGSSPIHRQSFAPIRQKI